ncbi:MAG: hypothetical protein Q9179_001576 [Wetmoreana sp. 5 TL-2023]
MAIQRIRLLPPSKILKEELVEWYRLGCYHPVKLGDVFNCRYEVIPDAHDYYDEAGQWQIKLHTFERVILQYIGNMKTDHPGSKHIPKLFDHFQHTGPHGTHVCLVFQVMGRSLEVFSAQWKPSRIPSPIMQKAITELLFT